MLVSSLFVFVLIASLGFAYHNAFATSIPTNHGLSSIITVLTFPNSGLLKIIISFILHTCLS